MAHSLNHLSPFECKAPTTETWPWQMFDTMTPYARVGLEVLLDPLTDLSGISQFRALCFPFESRVQVCKSCFQSPSCYASYPLPVWSPRQSLVRVWLEQGLIPILFLAFTLYLSFRIFPSVPDLPFPHSCSLIISKRALRPSVYLSNV